MNIGIVLSKTPSYSETFFVSKIKGLQNHGFDVTLFVQDKTNDFTLCAVKIAPKVFNRNLPVQIIAFLLMFFKILPLWSRIIRFIKLEKAANRDWSRIIKNIYNNAHILRADLDWVHFGFTTLSLNSEHVAKAIKANMAVSFRGFDLDVYPLKHPGCYQLLWQEVNKVHSISNYLLQKAYTLGLTNDVSHQIITPAVDSSLVKNTKIAKRKPLYFVTVARLHWIKGLQATLEALVLLKVKNIEFKYQIIGDGAEHEALMFAIHQLELSEHVELVGKLSHQKTLNALSQADIYIQYSYSEGFCNAVLEAQAMGVLCVVSNGGALPENVIHGKTGWVVPKGQPKKLAISIEKVISLSDEQKNEIRYYAKKRVQDQFNFKKQLLEFRDFYETSAS